MRGYNKGTRPSSSPVILVATFTFLFFNLLAVVASSSSRKCATLYNGQFHRGTPYSLTDGDKRPSLREMNFAPSSVQVSDGCVLTIFDVRGNKKTVETDLQNLGWSSNSLLDAACCECDSCRGASNQLGGLCARLYENLRCDSCSGFRLDFKDGDAAKNFGVLNNKMASVAVRSGCTLTVFYEKDFLGWRHNFTGSNNMMGANWIRQISSAKCGCSNDRQPVPTGAPLDKSTWPPVTFPTTSNRPPITQPSVPTRPPMTLPTLPPVTRPSITTRSPVTQPTVPTTATTTTNRIITLPTVPTSEEVAYDYKDTDYYLGGDKSSEISESTTSPTSTTTVTQPSSQSNVYGFEDEDENDEMEEVEENEDDDEEEVEEEDEGSDEDSWGWNNWSK